MELTSSVAEFFKSAMPPNAVDSRDAEGNSGSGSAEHPGDPCKSIVASIAILGKIAKLRTCSLWEVILGLGSAAAPIFKLSMRIAERPRPRISLKCSMTRRETCKMVFPSVWIKMQPLCSSICNYRLNKTNVSL